MIGALEAVYYINRPGVLWITLKIPSITWMGYSGDDRGLRGRQGGEEMGTRKVEKNDERVESNNHIMKHMVYLLI